MQNSSPKPHLKSISFLSIQLRLHFPLQFVGLPTAKTVPLFDGLTEEMGFYTSKTFLPKVTAASKPGMKHSYLFCEGFKYHHVC